MNYEQMTLWDAETALIEAALKRNNNNKTKAAKELGITTNTLSSRLYNRGLTEKYRKNKSKVNPSFGE